MDLAAIPSGIAEARGWYLALHNVFLGDWYVGRAAIDKLGRLAPAIGSTSSTENGIYVETTAWHDGFPTSELTTFFLEVRGAILDADRRAPVGPPARSGSA